MPVFKIEDRETIVQVSVYEVEVRTKQEDIRRRPDRCTKRKRGILPERVLQRRASMDAKRYECNLLR